MKQFTLIYLGLGLVATVATMWSYGKWATTIPEAATCLLAAVWCGAIAAGRVRPRLNILLIPLSGAVLWGAVQLAAGTTVYGHRTELSILYWLSGLATFAAALQAFADPDLRRRFLGVLTVFGLIVCVFSVVHALTSGDLVYWRFPSGWSGPIFGPFLYHNQFAAFVELLLPIALFQAIDSSRNRIFYLLVVAVMYGAVLFTGSRGGFLLTTAELVAVPALASQRRRIGRGQILRAAAVVAFILAWFAIPAGPDLLFERLGLKDPYSGRREFTLASIPMLRDRPLMGVGLGNWATVYPAYATFDDGTITNQAHDDWAQWAVEGGIPFLALMVWIAVYSIPRALRSGWGVGVPVIFAHCLFDYPIQRPGVALVFFIVLAAVAASDKRENAAPA